MSVTIRDVVGLELFRRGGARVVAGQAGLDNAVRWVHVTELPDIAHLLTGGELILTTGMGITDDEGMQARYIAELAQAGISGVVIELGRHLERVPSALVRSAEEANLPLITLDQETRFVDVTETVHREIISHQYELRSRAEAVSGELTELILAGADASRIVSRMAEIFANTVVLEDEAHQIVEIAGPDSENGEILSAWAEHSRTGHEESSRGAVHHWEGGTGCLWVGLWLRHQPWGRLHVLSTATRFEEGAELLVDRAGVALSLSLLLEKDAAHMADRARAALVGEILAGRHGSGGEFLRRARSLGADLGNGPLIVVALEISEPRPSPERRHLTEEERLRTRLVVAEEMRAAAHDLGCAALVGLSGDRLFTVVSSDAKRQLQLQVEDIVALVIERMASSSPAARFFVGASSEVDADSVERGIEEATATLGFSRRSDGARLVHHFTDLGTFQLLMSLSHGPDLARFVEYELRQLLDHDARTKAKLLPTLRAYLQHAGRKSDVVRELGIQRRTLYARLERIEALLRRDLDHQDTRTRLTLALQGLDVLQDREVVSTSPRRRS